MSTSLQSKTLQCLSAMDPILRGHSQTGSELRKLTAMMDHLLPDVDTHQEILQYNVDQSLPSFQDGDDVVRWWACVDDTGKYPGLCQAVKAAMSIFHGPLVESSFNIIDKKSTSFNIIQRNPDCQIYSTEQKAECCGYVQPR